MQSADVETLTGTLDFASWNDVIRTDWCKTEEGVEDPECARMSVSQWQKLLSDAETNYPISYDNETETGSATCTARRFLTTPNNYMEIKKAVPYTVTSGFKIYNSVEDYDSGTVGANGSGSAQEFLFDAATTLFAGAAALTASLLA